MKNFKDRIPAEGMANRKLITPESGTPFYAFVTNADNGEAGTPLNRGNMMAMQGFANSTIVRNDDGSYTETFDDGSVCTITRTDNGYSQTLTNGDQTITATITRTENGWQEVLS